MAPSRTPSIVLLLIAFSLSLVVTVSLPFLQDLDIARTSFAIPVHTTGPNPQAVDRIKVSDQIFAEVDLLTIDYFLRTVWDMVSSRPYHSNYQLIR